MRIVNRFIERKASTSRYPEDHPPPACTREASGKRLLRLSYFPQAGFYHYPGKVTALIFSASFFLRRTSVPSLLHGSRLTAHLLPVQGSLSLQDATLQVASFQGASLRDAPLPLSLQDASLSLPGFLENRPRRTAYRSRLAVFPSRPIPPSFSFSARYAIFSKSIVGLPLFRSAGASLESLFDPNEPIPEPHL